MFVGYVYYDKICLELISVFFLLLVNLDGKEGFFFSSWLMNYDDNDRFFSIFEEFSNFSLTTSSEARQLNKYQK